MLKLTNVPKPINDYEFTVGGFEGRYLNKDFKVKLNGQEAVCYNTRCSAIPFNRGYGGIQRQLDQTELLGLVSFEADEEVVVEVEVEKDFERALVRPLSKNIDIKSEGKKVTFTLKKAGQYCLELDDEHTCLNLFFNPIQEFATPEKYTKYYGAGVHVVGLLPLTSGDRIYIDANAILLGGIYGRDVQDVVIEGYGMIDGGILDRVDGFYRSTFMLHNCSNITVNGIILSDSPFWCCAMYNCQNIHIDNMKITGQWRYNTDGIDIVSCKDVSVKNSFIHAFDDVITLKGLSHYEGYTIDSVENIHIDNCVMWCGWGRSIEIGIETFDKEHKNISFTNCDLIHNSASAIDVQNGNCGHVHNFVVQHVNVEFQRSTMPEILQHTLDQKYDGYGKIGMPYLIFIGNHRYIKWIAPGMTKEFLDIVYSYTDDDNNFGQVSDVLIDDIHVYAEEGLPNFKVKVFSDDPNNSFENICISNVYINGKKVESMDGFDACIDERLKNCKLFD